MMEWVFKYLYSNLERASARIQPLINFEILLLVNSVYRNMPPTFMQTRGNIKVAQKTKFCLPTNLTLIHGQTEWDTSVFIKEHMANKAEYPRHKADEIFEPLPSKTSHIFLHNQRDEVKILWAGRETR